MAFSYQTKVKIFQNAGGQCQCTRQTCDHWVRCAKRCTPVSNALRALLNIGDEYIFPGFEFHHTQSQESEGPDTPANGEFLCVECHQRTKTYGSNLTR